MVTAIQVSRVVEELPAEALGWEHDKIEAWVADLASHHYQEWYIDGDLLAAVDAWRRRVRRRIEDRIRKDPVALAAAAAAVRVSLA